MADDSSSNDSRLTATLVDGDGEPLLALNPALNGNLDHDAANLLPTPEADNDALISEDSLNPTLVEAEHIGEPALVLEPPTAQVDTGEPIVLEEANSEVEEPVAEAELSAIEEPISEAEPPTVTEPTPNNQQSAINNLQSPPLSQTLGTAPLVSEPVVVQPEPVPEGMEWDDVPTQILPSHQRTLGLLPPGALLHDRYIVRQAVSQAADRNIYRAEDFERSPGAPPTYYTVSEYAMPGLVEGQSGLTGLDHPSVLPVAEHFSYQPYGEARYYAVYPATAESIHLSELPLPQASERVLRWAGQLADAVAYLHQRGVYCPGLSADNILIDNDRALLGSVSGAQTAASQQEQTDLARDDVRELARTIALTLTGDQTAAAENLSRLTAEGRPLPYPLQEVLIPALRGEVSDARAFAEQLKGVWRMVAAPPTDLILHSGKMTHVGMTRRNNQDSLAALECGLMTQSLSGGCGVYVVADGMGGHQSGEVASAIAVNTVVARLLHDTIVPLYSEAASEEVVGEQVAVGRVAAAIEEANDQIHALRASQGTDMGTTTVALLVMDGRAYIGNVGDSRLYLYRPDVGLQQITKDHSLVARLIELGQITPAEAEYHPHRHVVFRSMGEKRGVNVDTFVEHLQAGDRLLLCSDGINNMVSDAQIAEVLQTVADPQEAAERLVAMANAAGGVDNSSLIVINVERVRMANE